MHKRVGPVHVRDSSHKHNRPISLNRIVQLMLNTVTFMTNQMFSITVIICTAGRGEVCSRCNLLADVVTAALFILQHTPSDSAQRGSEEGCSALITAPVINSFSQGRGKQPPSFPQLKF